jgi:hypothetical protein
MSKFVPKTFVDNEGGYVTPLHIEPTAHTSVRPATTVQQFFQPRPAVGHECVCVLGCAMEWGCACVCSCKCLSITLSAK